MLDARIEAAARAMAKYRLSTHSFSRSLGPELVDDLQRAAEDRVWPTLVEEARVALEAADRIAPAQGDRALTQSDRALHGPLLESADDGSIEGRAKAPGAVANGGT